VGAGEERNRAAREQETREAQQELRKWRSPERQRRSKAAHGQENRKAQQKRKRVVHPQREKAQQERGVVNRRLGEPSKC